MVETKYIRDFIAENPFFTGMKPEYIDLIAGCGELAHFEKGSFLMNEGDAATKFYLILEGAVAIEAFCPVRGPLTVSRIKEGDVVGVSWLFPPYRVQFDAHALTDVRAVALHGKCLHGKTEKDHELGYELMTRFSRLLIRRLQATRQQLLDIYGDTDAASK